MPMTTLPRGLPEECVSIKDTNACSPWSEGYHINVTAIKEIYSLDATPTAQTWSDIVVSLAYGGDLLKDTMKSVAGCDGPNYNGDTMQFMRTNLCLYDLFTVSARCNPKVPKHTICPDTCDAYQSSMDSLLKDEASCPDHSDSPKWEEMKLGREFLAQQSDVCTAQIQKWSKGVPDYKDRCFVGVSDDLKSCGLGGNIAEAAEYCKAFPKADCCAAYAKAKASGYKGVDPPKSIITSGAGSLSVPTARPTPPGAPKPTTPSPSKTDHPYPECLPIDETSACAPWSKGYYINATAIGLQYGLTPLKNVSEWDEAVSLLTSGGDLLKQVIGDYTGCSGYAGEPIQFLKTYVCLIDIFDFSEKCNRAVKMVPPKKPLCTETCHAYGASVGSLMADVEACPDLSAKLSKETWGYLQRTRKDVADGGSYCAAGVGAWKNQDVGCIEAVDSDYFSCGFAGNQQVAERYCADLKANNRTPTCCNDLTNLPPRLTQKSSLTTQERDVTAQKEAAESWIDRNKTAVIITSILVTLLLLLLLAICITRSSRRNAHARNNRVATAGYASSSSSSSYPESGASLMTQKKEGMPFASAQKSFGTGARGAKRTKVASHAYVPQLSDEIELRVDDVVEVLAEYDDGWGKGMNVRTKAVGTFPMACLRS
ncbi:hypothetical protein HDU67_007679 [Dinochytrium kinnereticum]|nr:hypothetical protein HDU67_007679 [Dinochytrium kinnereticum]